ncbi:unnamed protein product [Haemonchus placei]|uniref:Uncharacterized protein n=1 Tax=Haemonchus placei TaxID=6290 RepID=A0A0N4VSW0_HAEPC|nr:unnamed protein product [Haemonchus placei]
MGTLDAAAAFEPGAPPAQTRGTYQLDAIAPKLPSVPVPIFEEKICDFSDFWTLFEANMDSQHSLNGLQQFNYLLSALRGETRRFIKGYPIGGDNYTLAVEYTFSTLYVIR